MRQKTTYTEAIKEEALKLGFDDCGFTSVRFLRENYHYFMNWIGNGYNAGMQYLAKNVNARTNPSELIKDAKSVISVILNYYPAKSQSDPEAPVISKYAYGKDYHLVMKEKLTSLLTFIQKIIPGTNGRVFADSSPVLEKEWAHQCGLGWIGKNSLLLNPRYGSFVFIGELIISRELEYNSPIQNLCGTCRKCIDACPTGAIIENRIIDAGRCISYLTIENKMEINPSLQNKLANCVYGCDICQNVCPWNNNLAPHKIKEFDPLPGLLEMTAEEWKKSDEKRFKELFRESVILRVGYARFKRNLEIIPPK